MRTRTTIITTRLSAVALAVASAACAPRGAAAQDAAPGAAAAPATRPSATAAPEPLRQKADERAAEADDLRAKTDQIRAARESIHEKQNALRARTLAPSQVPVGPYTIIGRAASDAPLVLITRAVDDAALAEMKEDLSVMDKLVRDEVARAGGEDPERPWGIKLTMVGRFAPTYLEGGGAVFSAAVNFPLRAVAGGQTAQQQGKPREPDSKWIRTKRQMAGGGGGGLPGVFELQPDGKTQPPPFDQAKFDALRAAVVQLLPEAKNFRHLGENESVFVTISGIDDAGGAARMTLRATKADIDAAAAGTLSSEEFARRVTQRIG